MPLVNPEAISQIQLVVNGQVKTSHPYFQKYYKNGGTFTVRSIKFSDTPAEKIDPAILDEKYSIPAVMEGVPEPGKRVFRQMAKYANTQLRHVIYLPKDYVQGRRYPIMVEYTGNSYYNTGNRCYSSGHTKDGNQAMSLTRGEGFIVLNLPFVSVNGQYEMIAEMGDQSATAQYCMDAVKDACENFHGDISKVIYTGFSRGGEAANVIALHNDEIASLWKGFCGINHTKAPPTRGWAHQFAPGWEERRQRGLTIPFFDEQPSVGGHVDVKYLENSKASTDARRWLKELVAGF